MALRARLTTFPVDTVYPPASPIVAFPQDVLNLLVQSFPFPRRERVCRLSGIDACREQDFTLSRVADSCE